MKFHCDGSDYDTEQLIAFPTRNRAMPVIYMAPDFSRVFVQTMDRSSGVRIRQASVDEIQRLSLSYNLPLLLRAVPRVEGQTLPGDTLPAEGHA